MEEAVIFHPLLLLALATLGSVFYIVWADRSAER